MFIVFAAVLLALVAIPAVCAASNLEVRQVDKGSVIISELDNPAVFDFVINNKGGKGYYEIYSFVGVAFSPRGTFELTPGENKMEVKAWPGAEARKRTGPFIFDYQIKGAGDDIYSGKITIAIVGLKDTLEIKPENVHYGDEVASVTIYNTQNTNLEKLGIKFKSALFEGEKEISLAPLEKTTISFDINGEKAKKLVAGPYVLTADIALDGAKTRLDGVVNYLEKQNTSIVARTGGIIIRTTEVTKKNEGNTEVTDKIEVRRNILTRLFTTHSAAPMRTERKGIFVYYEWEKELKPSEMWSINTTTNYTFPFLFVILVAFAAVMVYIYSRTSVVLQKRVSYVKTTGGNFALKVRVNVKARKSVEGLDVIDRIPSATKLYEKFGVLPSKIDEVTRTMTWNIGRLNAGEERAFSYIIYSNIKIFGAFELPRASARFIRDNKQEITSSNKTFFVSDVHAQTD